MTQTLPTYFALLPARITRRDEIDSDDSGEEKTEAFPFTALTPMPLTLDVREPQEEFGYGGIYCG